jgi:hypothetical protein
LIHRINEFRNNNVKYKPKRDIDNIGGSGFYYGVYFYLPSEKVTILCVINISDQVNDPQK